MTPTQLSKDRAEGAGGVPVIVGAGLAGLVTALRMAPSPVVVLASQPLGLGAASGWAQGGIAAALGADDSPDLHAADTVAAGGGLCEAEVVSRITAAAPAAVAYLGELGARFDRTPDGGYRLGLEGAHSRNRIVHASGDGTGAEVLRAVVQAVRHTNSITVVEGALARRVVIEDGRVTDLFVEVEGRTVRLTTDRVVLATGGSGQLWRHTTNPSGSRGQGLALAARAGAELRDLEMVQFHPTALDVGLDPMPLVSEAVRGAGALLVDAVGRPLTDNPLAARDVVARAVWGELSRGGRVYLDARNALGDRFTDAFPTVAQACLAAGVDPATDLIPVRPAAHYQCGGVTVDLRGRTTLPGLWAVGEVASTGLHGANRLASNSLLEALVCAGWVADDMLDDLAAGPTAAMPWSRPGDVRPTSGHVRTSAHVPTSTPFPSRGHVPTSTPFPSRGHVPSSSHAPSGGCAAQVEGAITGAPKPGPGFPWVATSSAVWLAKAPDEVRALMDRSVGILRTGEELEAAEAALLDACHVDGQDLDDTTLIALLVAHSARMRLESRGGHTRLDHPRTDDHAMHTTVTLDDVLPGSPAVRAASADLVPAGGSR